ncbi:MAG TPA: hypothetical protein DCX77_00905 [Acidimicrobiaceae bacterium]|nr:hypothetical protein [Acidimicrobiaceae bacterium]|tara:strand:+ start:104 stop:901 length:798 start_codon:yes stop_codon:yes gene_type:complete
MDRNSSAEGDIAHVCVLTINIERTHREHFLDATDVRGLLGLLLVDGSLVPYRSPAGGYIQMTLTAGVKSSAFLEDKVNEFRQFFPTRAQITPYKSSPRDNGKRTTVLRFRVSTNKLRPVYNLLYPAGERAITQTALDLLGAKAAAWCWAEGAKYDTTTREAELARVGNTWAEASRLQSWLAMLTGATSELKEYRHKPRLYFTAPEAVKIQQSLIEYAPKSRLHLFTGDIPDVSAIRSARTELLLGGRQHQSAGEQASPMAADRSA